MKRLNLRGPSKVLFFVFLMLLIAGIVYAQSVDIGSSSGSPDTDVTLPIMLNYEASTPDISAICIDIGFDPDVLEYVSTESGPAASEAEKEAMANLLSSGLLYIAILGYNQNIIQDGIVAYVTFHIKPTAFGDIILTNTPSASDPNGDPVTVTSANGTVNIVRPQPDIKANGSDDPITLNYSHTLSITVALNNNRITKDADWWLAAIIPSSEVYFYTLEGWTDVWLPACQGPLFFLNSFEMFKDVPISGFPIGIYTFCFCVDTNRDGNVTWNSLDCDIVVVNIE